MQYQMKKANTNGAIARVADGSYQVTGHLVFDTVRDLLRSSADVLQTESQQSIDLSGVASADSAGLALLIEWYCAAENAKRTVRFIGVPNQLRALAKLSNLETVLPLG
jgi:phospholipid transport system transporter-binding protein